MRVEVLNLVSLMACRVHLLSLSYSPGCSVLSHRFFPLEVSITVFKLTASFHC